MLYVLHTSFTYGNMISNKVIMFLTDIVMFDSQVALHFISVSYGAFTDVGSCSFIHHVASGRI